MIQIDKTDYLYKTLQKLGVDEQDIEKQYIQFAESGVSTVSDFNNNLQSGLGMDYLGEFDENCLEDVLDYYNDLRKSKMPSKNRVVSLLKEYKQNPSEKLRTDIINSQLKEVLLIACAYKLRHEDIDLNDLVQVCNIGLMTAVEKFDVNSKLSFEIYLNYWILNAINKEYTLGEQKNG